SSRACSVVLTISGTCVDNSPHAPEHASGTIRSLGGARDPIVPSASSDYDLTLPGVEDANSGGDLDVDICPGELLRICGGAANNTLVNGEQIDRVFDVRSLDPDTG